MGLVKVLLKIEKGFDLLYFTVRVMKVHCRHNQEGKMAVVCTFLNSQIYEKQNLSPQNKNSTLKILPIFFVNLVRKHVYTLQGWDSGRLICIM